MQEVLMLIAAALMTLSVYKSAALEENTASHFAAALAAQGLGAEATANARGLVLDALGPGDGHRVGGYKCLTFDIVATPIAQTTMAGSQCRAVLLTVGGSADAVVEGNLCPTPNGPWAEPAQGQFTSRPIDFKWRDTVLKKGADLYHEPELDAPKTKFDWPDTKVQVGGYVYRTARTFALIRLPNGETRYAAKDDLAPAVR